MGIRSCGYLDFPDANIADTENRDVPIGLFPQLFEVYKWLQECSRKYEASWKFEIPDKVEHCVDDGWWSRRRVSLSNDAIEITAYFSASELGKFEINICLWYNNDSVYDNIFTEKDKIDLSLIEKKLKRILELDKELKEVQEQGQREIDKKCSEIMGRYK